MTVCPIAIAVGCQKCPAFKICPAKSILGDQPKAGEKQPEKKRRGRTAVAALTHWASPCTHSNVAVNSSFQVTT